MAGAVADIETERRERAIRQLLETALARGRVRRELVGNEGESDSGGKQDGSRSTSTDLGKRGD